MRSVLLVHQTPVSPQCHELYQEDEHNYPFSIPGGE